uniref:espin-like n=1 Tax=Myxine glutinosa TaxID=7769 RepID=UPI00358FC9E9
MMRSANSNGFKLNPDDLDPGRLRCIPNYQKPKTLSRIAGLKELRLAAQAEEENIVNGQDHSVPIDSPQRRTNCGTLPSRDSVDGTRKWVSPPHSTVPSLPSSLSSTPSVTPPQSPSLSPSPVFSPNCVSRANVSSPEDRVGSPYSSMSSPHGGTSRQHSRQSSVSSVFNMANPGSNHELLEELKTKRKLKPTQQSKGFTRVFSGSGRKSQSSFVKQEPGSQPQLPEINGSNLAPHTKPEELITKVPTVDHKGLPIPEWKREMMFKKLHRKLSKE